MTGLSHRALCFGGDCCDWFHCILDLGANGAKPCRGFKGIPTSRLQYFYGDVVTRVRRFF